MEEIKCKILQKKMKLEQLLGAMYGNNTINHTACLRFTIGCYSCRLNSLGHLYN